MKKYILLSLLVALALSASDSFAQKRSKEKSKTEVAASPENPRLVVGIVVDQMRFDYLTRFGNHFVTGGFNRLTRDGFNCKNNHFNYAQTSTAPGHTSIFTGTTPSVHGIIGNNWYDKKSRQMVYCVSDSSYASVGTTSDAGEVSPHRLNVTTVTDQLRLHYQMRSKVIAVAIKDRGAVLPGGHSANAAYWFHGYNEGKWVSSSYYMNELPDWVKSFNDSRIIDKYKKPWNTLKSIELYKESGPDNTPYEYIWEGEEAPVFPHDLPNLWDRNNQYEILKYSPYGNSITTDFAIAAITGEQLGKDSTTDFLSVSYSSTDLVGHEYGVNSKEIQDIYLRLDLELQRLLNTLDHEVGKGEYTVFLTADHGAMHVAKYLYDQKLPGRPIKGEDFKPAIMEYLKYRFGTTDILEYHTDNKLFLDHRVIANLDLNLGEVQQIIADEILTFDGIDRVFTAHQLQNTNYTEGIARLVKKGYHQKRSGDVIYIPNSGYADDDETGSSHGSPFVYDTHVPLLFYGKGINKGSTVRRTEITDIAPTISALLGIAYPSGKIGEPIGEVLK